MRSSWLSRRRRRLSHLIGHLIPHSALSALIMVLTAVTASAGDCGAADNGCQISDGDYHVLIPDRPPQARGYPVVLFLHGWASSGKSALAFRKVVGPVLTRGYIFLAPNALRAASGKRDWSVRDGQPTRRDELAFLENVLGDLGKRYSIDRGRVLLAGFSRGGSMVWDLACESPGAFRAYAPLAGGFWEPLPKTCAGPVRLFHTHGWKDATVPLEGRRLRDTPYIRGNIFAGLEVWRQTNLCASRPAEERVVEKDRWLRTWRTCAPDAGLSFLLHPGGHSIPVDWADRMLDWFETESDTDAQVAGQQ